MEANFPLCAIALLRTLNVAKEELIGFLVCRDIRDLQSTIRQRQYLSHRNRVLTKSSCLSLPKRLCASILCITLSCSEYVGSQNEKQLDIDLWALWSHIHSGASLVYTNIALALLYCPAFLYHQELFVDLHHVGIFVLLLSYNPEQLLAC